MKVNSSAIYETKGREHFKKGKVSFTISKNGSINAIYLADENETQLPSEIIINGVKSSKGTLVKMLGHGKLNREKISGGLKVFIPETVSNNPPCDYAWAFVISDSK